MKIHKVIDILDEFKNILISDIDNEIHWMEELSDILNSGEAIISKDGLSDDLNLIKTKMKTYKDVKGMIKKASVGSSELDTTIIMTADERKVFYKMIKFIMFFRKLFRINK